MVTARSNFATAESAGLRSETVRSANLATLSTVARLALRTVSLRRPADSAVAKLDLAVTISEPSPPFARAGAFVVCPDKHPYCATCRGDVIAPAADGQWPRVCHDVW